MHGEDHDDEYSPTGECADSSTQASLIEEESYADGSKDLREPVHEIV